MNKSRRIGRLIVASTTTALVVTIAPFASAVSSFGGSSTSSLSSLGSSGPAKDTPAPECSLESGVKFSVSNITDFHGYLSEDGYNKVMGAALLAGLNNQINGDENIFTTSGDNVGGSAFVSAISNDEYTIDFLNAAGIEASAVGNHEFDQGVDDLQSRLEVESEFPILGANVYKDGERLLDASTVVEREGVKIGFVGTVTQETKNKVSPAGVEGVEFHDAVAETNAEAKRLKDSGEADVVIALFHEDAEAFVDGFDTDYVDALFGGDSHVVASGDTPMIYAQSGEYGKVLTDIDFTYDTESGEIVCHELTQYDYDNAVELGAEADPAVAEIVAAAEEQADVLGEEVVATLANAFSRGNDYALDDNGASSVGNNRGSESTLNHLLAEAARWSMENFLDEEVELGFMNAGGVRADLPAGDVTYAEAFAVQPFGNSIAIGDLTGADILAALEDQWKDPSAGRPRLALGLSDNVSYSYDASAAQGERVINATIDGVAIDPTRTYSVAMSSFLFEGGDGFNSFTNVTNYRDVGYNDVQAFIDYLEANASVEPRGAQGDVGVEIEGTVAAGETITLNLSSLNYSTESEPQASTVTVTLGSEEITESIDTQFTSEFDGLNDHGIATVELTIPAGLSGVQNIEITTDTGTAVSVPLNL